MNAAQIAQAASALRIIIAFVGGLAVAKGLVPQEMINRASDITTLTQIVGGLAAAGAGIYAVWRRRPAGTMKDAAKVLADPKVRTVAVPADVADAIPSDKVVAR